MLGVFKVMFCDHLFFLVFQDVNSCPVLPQVPPHSESFGGSVFLGLVGAVQVDVECR